MSQFDRPQFELPQISLQRYLDLLKRRRWQVIPVSLLGLVIGGLVAFLIPRYYVADTVISYSRAPGDERQNPLEDPMVEQVDIARMTIPLAVGDTLRQLGWEGYQTLDPYAAQEYERAVRSRIEIIDQNAGSRVRSYAQLRITYRDRDGQRAADLLNRLVQTWIERQMQTLRDNAAQALAAANDRADRALRSFERASAEVRDHEVKHGLQPGLTPQDEAMLKREVEAQRAAMEKERGELQVRQEVLTAELEQLTAQLDRTPRSLPAGINLTAQVDPESAVGKKLVELAFVQRALESHGPAHPDRLQREAQLRRLQQELRKLQGLEAEGDEVPNPRWQELKRRQAEKEVELKGVLAGVERLDAALAAAAERRADMAAVLYEYRGLQQTLQDAVAARQKATEEVELRTRIRGLLDNERPIDVRKRALVPPRPTEPNVLLVALIGCIIGLGAAIGLILLIDLLQGTFKTVDDVERGLPVPLLGAMSHLESEERRVRTARGRRRASLVAGAVVVLILAAVTIYYVDPTRLPPFARDLLALVLGN